MNMPLNTVAQNPTAPQASATLSVPPGTPDSISFQKLAGRTQSASEKPMGQTADTLATAKALTASTASTPQSAAQARQQLDGAMTNASAAYAAWASNPQDPESQGALMASTQNLYRAITDASTVGVEDDSANALLTGVAMPALARSEHDETIFELAQSALADMDSPLSRFLTADVANRFGPFAHDVMGAAQRHMQGIEEPEVPEVPEAPAIDPTQARQDAEVRLGEAITGLEPFGELAQLKDEYNRQKIALEIELQQQIDELAAGTQGVNVNREEYAARYRELHKDKYQALAELEGQIHTLENDDTLLDSAQALLDAHAGAIESGVYGPGLGEGIAPVLTEQVLPQLIKAGRGTEVVDMLTEVLADPDHPLAQDPATVERLIQQALVPAMASTLGRSAVDEDARSSAAALSGQLANLARAGHDPDSPVGQLVAGLDEYRQRLEAFAQSDDDDNDADQLAALMQVDTGNEAINGALQGSTAVLTNIHSAQQDDAGLFDFVIGHGNERALQMLYTEATAEVVNYIHTASKFDSSRQLLDLGLDLLDGSPRAADLFMRGLSAADDIAAAAQGAVNLLDNAAQLSGRISPVVGGALASYSLYNNVTTHDGTMGRNIQIVGDLLGMASAGFGGAAAFTSWTGLGGVGFGTLAAATGLASVGMAELGGYVRDGELDGARDEEQTQILTAMGIDPQRAAEFASRNNSN
ncbi:MAG: hypothetical protein ACFCBW_00455 [Candidatus Competibacterales bacterium]